MIVNRQFRSILLLTSIGSIEISHLGENKPFHFFYRTEDADTGDQHCTSSKDQTRETIGSNQEKCDATTNTPGDDGAGNNQEANPSSVADEVFRGDE